MPKIKKNEENSPTIKTPRKTISRKTMDSSLPPATTPKTPIRRTKISQAVCDDQCKMIETITPRRSTRHVQPSSTTKQYDITPKTRIINSATKLSIKKKENELKFLSPEPPKSVKKIAEKKSATKVRQTFQVSSSAFFNDDESATKTGDENMVEDINQGVKSLKAKTPSKKSSRRETTIIKRDDSSIEDVTKKSSRQTIDDSKSPDLSEEVISSTDSIVGEINYKPRAEATLSKTPSKKLSRQTLIVPHTAILNEVEETDRNLQNDVAVTDKNTESNLKTLARKSSRKTIITSPIVDEKNQINLEGAESTSKSMIISKSPDEINSKTLARKSSRQTMIAPQATILNVEDNDENVTNDVVTEKASRKTMTISPTNSIVDEKNDEPLQVAESTSKTPSKESDEILADAECNAKTITRKSSRKTMIEPQPTVSNEEEENDKNVANNVAVIEKTPLKKSPRKTMTISPAVSIVDEKNDEPLQVAESTSKTPSKKSSRQTMFAPQAAILNKVEENDKNVSNDVVAATEKTPESNSKTLTKKSSRNKTMNVSQSADSSVEEENDEIIAASKTTPRKSSIIIVTQPDENDCIIADAAIKKTNFSKNRCSLIVGSGIKNDDDNRRASVHTMSTHEYEELLQDDNSKENDEASNEAENIESAIEKKNDNENTDANENDEIIENTTFELKSPKYSRNSDKNISMSPMINKSIQNKKIDNELIAESDETRISLNVQTDINESQNRTFEMNTSNIPANSTFEMNTSKIQQNTIDDLKSPIISIKKSAAVIHTIDLTDTPPIQKNIKNFGVIDLVGSPSPVVPSTSKASVAMTTTKSALTPLAITEQFKVKKLSVMPLSKIASVKKTPKRLERTPKKIDIKSSSKHVKSNLMPIFAETTADQTSKNAIRKTPKRLQKTPYKFDNLSKSKTKIDFIGDSKIFDKKINTMILSPNVLSSPLKGIRKRSFSVTEPEKKNTVRFNDNLENIQMIENRPMQRNQRTQSQSDIATKQKKLPDFAAIHLKMQEKMESISDYEARKLRRHIELSASKVLQAKLNKTKSTNEPAAQKSLFDKKTAPLATNSSTSSSTLVTFATSTTQSKVDDRRNKCKNMYKKTGTDCDSSTAARSEMLKGVRLNRRFDLQMKYRNNLDI